MVKGHTITKYCHHAETNMIFVKYTNILKFEGNEGKREIFLFIAYHIGLNRKLINSRSSGSSKEANCHYQK